MSQCCGNRRERGYILLTLMLFVAILAIGAMAWIEKVDFQIKRDREEELIHRGVQYSRAVRRYFKKFGRYPTRIEELESTNNLRFLRKRYTDPITGKDFKPLHLTDVQISFNPGAASGLPPGPDANISAPQPGTPGALNTPTAPTSDTSAGAILQNQQAPQGTDQGDTTQATQTPQSNKASQGADQGDATQATQAPQSNNGVLPQIQRQGATGLGPGGAQVFGGGAIIGVASVSKLKTIREFNKKDHYNQWQFIYDPSTDRGGLLMTPNQPPLKGAVQPNQQQNGAPGTPGQDQTLGNQGLGNQGLGSQGEANPAPPQPNPAQPEQQ
jgi:type II secretory pathway pseudopilin PulG